ncbi:MAG: NADH-quinone oxidoreductase subunit NuoB [Cryobacterium sp.]|nr:NADH-quinone oxidoreductase subunit NuoB [Oligoflexia bacterium]
MSTFISSNLESLMAWAQATSLWTYSIGGGCCVDEMLSAQGCRYDLERFGCLPQSHPEQADLLIVSTAVTQRMSEVILEIYGRMPSPKYVMAVGACANGGGPFSERVTYAAARPLEEILPVDVYVPGCPPRPEALMNGLIRLQEKIRSG